MLMVTNNNVRARGPESVCTVPLVLRNCLVILSTPMHHDNNHIHLPSFQQQQSSTGGVVCLLAWLHVSVKQ